MVGQEWPRNHRTSRSYLGDVLIGLAKLSETADGPDPPEELSGLFNHVRTLYQEDLEHLTELFQRARSGVPNCFVAEGENLLGKVGEAERIVAARQGGA